jgi:glucokinase
MSSPFYFGIDVGGNHVKTGFVDLKGEIHDFQSFSTADWRDENNFIERLLDTIAFKLVAHKDVTKIGIGLPGMIDFERRKPLEIPSIPELNGTALKDMLEARFPGKEFCLENDANAAGLGELIFRGNHLPNTFAFITLGTGIGSAAIIDGKIFKGGDGNGLELGHIISRNHKRLEQNIGKQGIINLAAQMLDNYKGQTIIPRDQPISATKLVISANDGDEFCRSVFFEVGEILGEGLVALIRILDIKTIIVGGGLSASFEFIQPGIHKVLNTYLTPYYLAKIDIRLAELGNDAGILGAAALCFDNKA